MIWRGEGLLCRYPPGNDWVHNPHEKQEAFTGKKDPRQPS
jgi:hypothetical protein